MGVTAEEIAKFRAQAAALPDNGGEELRALETKSEVLAYLIAVTRAEGGSELHMVELVCRAAEYTRDDYRECERTLRPLGYGAVADLLHELAKKAKRGPSKAAAQKRRKREIADR